MRVGRAFEVLCVSFGDNMGNVTWRDSKGSKKFVSPYSKCTAWPSIERRGGGGWGGEKLKLRV